MREVTRLWKPDLLSPFFLLSPILALASYPSLLSALVKGQAEDPGGHCSLLSSPLLPRKTRQEALTLMMSPPLNTSVEEAAAGDHHEKNLLQRDDPAAIIARMPLSRTPSFLQRDAESDEEMFSQALLELKDLRSQLHYAADYCENAFLQENKERRRMVLESTKSYICEAIVAVVDHLGNVSSKLEERILDDGEIVATEQKMDCLKQRLLTCQQYAVRIEVSSLRWSISFPRHHHHYASPCSLAVPPGGKSSEISSSSTKASELDVSESPGAKGQFVLAVHRPVTRRGVVPTDTPSKSDKMLVKAVPVLENPSLLPKPCHTVFGARYEDACLLGIGDKKKKPMLANNFLSFLRVNKRRI